MRRIQRGSLCSWSWSWGSQWFHLCCFTQKRTKRKLEQFSKFLRDRNLEQLRIQNQVLKYIIVSCTYIKIGTDTTHVWWYNGGVGNCFPITFSGFAFSICTECDFPVFVIDQGMLNVGGELFGFYSEAIFKLVLVICKAKFGPGLGWKYLFIVFLVNLVGLTAFNVLKCKIRFELTIPFLGAAFKEKLHKSNFVFGGAQKSSVPVWPKQVM